LKTDLECRESRWWNIRKNHENILDVVRARGHYLRKNKSSQGGHYVVYPWQVKCSQYEYIELLEISRSME